MEIDRGGLGKTLSKKGKINIKYDFIYSSKQISIKPH